MFPRRFTVLRSTVLAKTMGMGNLHKLPGVKVETGYYKVT